MNRLKLPIGIQSFRRIREGGFYYVDKTAHIQRLTDGVDSYFLSRPRRFGKTLLLDTLKELFEGNEPLFRGLHIHDRWDWSQSHPVVRIRFGGKYLEPGELENDIFNQLEPMEKKADLTPSPSATTGPTRLRSLLHHLFTTTGKQVVVLVDEYDKPVLDLINRAELARANRDYLRGFYGIIKECDELIRFTFVTGISMFSRANLFSGLNHLTDLSLSPGHATICGYTEGELDTVFAPELEGLDRERIRQWYNGYHWLGEEKVYNPYGLLQLLQSRQFRLHWFKSGTPGFLYDLMREKEFSTLELENLSMGEMELTEFEIDDISPEALLFQAGYLTLVRLVETDTGILYELDYPNHEVRQGFHRGFLQNLGKQERELSELVTRLKRCLSDSDFESMESDLRSFLAGIPYQWHSGNDLARHEAWYATLMYSVLMAAGLDLQVEESTARGRSDLVVRHDGQVFVFEFKVVPGEKEGEEEGKVRQAINQIRERDYAEKYRTGSGSIHLVGMVFGAADRNLLTLEAASL